jgi:hypothetical protein
VPARFFDAHACVASQNWFDAQSSSLAQLVAHPLPSLVHA